MSRTFSLAEVNALLPELEATCARLDRLEGELGARANELERIGHAALAPPAALARAAAQPLAGQTERRVALRDEVRREVDELHAALAARGAVWLDVESRAIGFPATVAGARVLLAWRPGLDAVAHFVTPDDPERWRPLAR
jgi:hypothetical protein